MSGALWKKLILLGVLFAGAWLAVRYLFPVALPFLLGMLVALAAEPVVTFGVRKLSLPRAVSVGVGVCLTLVLLTGLIWLICSLAAKELGQLANAVPNVQNTAQQGIDLLENWMTDLASRSPESIRPVLTSGVDNLFSGSSTLMNQASDTALKAAGNVLSQIPNSMLGLGTTLISAFLISQRLPRIKDRLRKAVSPKIREKYLPALRSVRKVLGKWLLAQLKLSAVTYGIVALGLILLRIPYGAFWAFAIALVDALPVLGAGTVLIPWIIICFLQGNNLRALGLLCTYGASSLTRAVLEPRLIGNQLGLDPLLTLIFLYVGFRFWGIAGMLIAPILAAAIKCAYNEFYRENRLKKS